MAYTPVQLTKGGKTTWTQTLEEEVKRRWDGWVSVGSPTPDDTWDVVRHGDLRNPSSRPMVDLKAMFAIGELAYAENVTNTPTPATNASLVDIPGTTITVPTCSQPVWLHASLLITVTAFTAAGNVNAAIAEINNGVDTPLLLGFQTSVVKNSQTVTLGYAYRIGPTARQRQFKLQVGLHSSGITAQAYNQPGGPSWLMARGR